jgi:hypothetical protein
LARFRNRESGIQIACNRHATASARIVIEFITKGGISRGESEIGQSAAGQCCTVGANLG